MIFNRISRDDGCECVGCGSSEFEGVSTIVKRNDGAYDTVTVCVGCLFRAAVGDKFDKALGRTAKPNKIPEPQSIKPRWFG